MKEKIEATPTTINNVLKPKL